MNTPTRWLSRGLAAIASLILGLGGASALAQNAAPLAAATAISKLPFTASKPGLYLVKKDLVFPGITGNAIDVTATNVIIDLGGHELSCATAGTDAVTARGIQHDISGALIVRNGTLAGFRRGIDSAGASNLFGSVIVEDVIVRNSTEMGMSLLGNYVDVHRCTVLDTGGTSQAAAATVYGISFQSNSVHIADNSISGLTQSVGQATVGIGGTSRGLITRNCVNGVISTSASTGISFASFAGIVSENTILECHAGISLPDIGGEVKYRDNTTAYCTTPFIGGAAVGTNN